VSAPLGSWPGSPSFAGAPAPLFNCDFSAGTIAMPLRRAGVLLPFSLPALRFALSPGPTGTASAVLLVGTSEALFIPCVYTSRLIIL
jgi:hypothetical protein